MKRLGQIFVLLLAIASLLTPVFAQIPAHCFSPAAAGHECCSQQAELLAPSCCPDATPVSNLPQSVSDQAAGIFLRSQQPAMVSLRNPSATLLFRTTTYPQILLPATVLRT
jgi:hypothetical protein